MSGPSENETWIIDAGDAVISKKATSGMSALSPIARLIYCLWVADYGMRNAGDLETAADLYANFQTEGAQIASDLSLSFTRESFALPTNELQSQYFQRFDRICDELQRC